MFVSIVDPNELKVSDQKALEANEDTVEGTFSNYG